MDFFTLIGALTLALSTFGILIILLCNSVIRVPYNRAAVLLTLEKDPRVLRSGLALRVPFIHRLVTKTWIPPIDSTLPANSAAEEVSYLSLMPTWHDPPASEFILHGGAKVKVDFSYSSSLTNTENETIFKAFMAPDLYYNFELNVERVARKIIGNCQSLQDCKEQIKNTIIKDAEILDYERQFGLKLVQVQFDRWSDDPARVEAARQEQEQIAQSKLHLSNVKRQQEEKLLIQENGQQFKRLEMEAENEIRQLKIAKEHELAMAEAANKRKLEEAEVASTINQERMIYEARVQRLGAEAKAQAESEYQIQYAGFNALATALKDLKNSSAAAFANYFFAKAVETSRSPINLIVPMSSQIGSGGFVTPSVMSGSARATQQDETSPYIQSVLNPRVPSATTTMRRRSQENDDGE